MEASLITLMVFETGLLSLAFAAWRAGVVKPAFASLTYFWSETVLARTVGALSLGVLAAGAVATTLLTESVLAPKSLARLWMAATSVAMILPPVLLPGW